MREPEITYQGAKMLAIAVENANRGFPAKEILSCLCFNLGLIRFGNQIDKQIVYNPIEHEDIEGGILPGEPVVVLEPGWMYKTDVLIRAKVRRNNSP
jgi:hypothetical protein